MRDLLRQMARDELLEMRRFLKPGTLLAFDYDGTLAPIVSRPKDVGMRASTRAVLRKLSRFYPIALISGRSHRDLSCQIRRLPVKAWVGNHGADWGVPDVNLDRFQAVTRDWLPHLKSLKRQIEGLEIEDKLLSLSVHYRRTSDPTRTKLLIENSVRKLPELRIVGGKYVVNLVPKEAPHKGDALRKLMKKLSCVRAVFFGDDLTDEDVFKLCPTPWLLGIRIGKSRNSKATFYIRDQLLIDELLERFLPT